MILSGRAGFLDVVAWSSKLVERTSQICRVEIKEGEYPIYGTGFLIGKDVIITAYHNFERVIENKTNFDPRCVTLYFDYKLLADGLTLYKGSPYHLASEDWLIDYSPVNTSQNASQSNGLDYILLRVEGSPGLEIMSENASGIRGWVEVIEEEYIFTPGESMLIMQYPGGGPLKIAFSSNAIISIDNDETQVTYKVDTLPGSSGSPCFNINLDLIALHIGGSFNLQANQGINMHAILKSLISHGHRDLVTRKTFSDVKDQTLDYEAIRYRRFAPDPALQARLADKETSTTEFKEGFCRNRITGKKDDTMRINIVEAVAGFMNSREGGVVIIGVRDDGTIRGINEEYEVSNKQKPNWDGYCLSLSETLDKNLSIENAFDLYTITGSIVEGKDVCIISVKAAYKPVYVHEVFFVRAGVRTIKREGPHLVEYVNKRWPSGWK